MVRTLGSLRNEDGNGYENVTQKVNLRCLKLNRAYSISFNSSKVGIFFFFGVEFQGTASKFRKRKRKQLSFVAVIDRGWGVGGGGVGVGGC